MKKEEEKPHISQPLSPDRPGEDPALDRLGHGPFAKHLADSILRLPNTEGLVIAVHGTWGAGKTTVLNYIRHFIGQAPEQQRPALVTFNPWWFSGTEDLIRGFFSQLQAHLSTAAGITSDLRNKLADLAEAVSDIPIPHAKLGSAALKLLRPKPKDVAKLKQEIATDLVRQGKRILVTIDDIDRLAPDEVRAVFKVVKAVADFPNITYLMAFDRAIVTNSLEGIGGGSGEDYLEKIVQVPFELPPADRPALRGLFFDRLDPILAGIDPKTWDQTYWGNVFFRGIDEFLETPRDIVRLTNALTVTFRAVIGEVNPVDFMALESLRLFCPDVYQTVRGNPEMFTGPAPVEYEHPTGEEVTRFHNEWFKAMEESNSRYAAPVRDMLVQLFPRLASVWGNMSYGTDWMARWRRDSRICDPEVFPVYFALAVNAGDISNSEIQTVLANAGNRDWLKTELLKLAKQLRPDGKTRASAILERLWDYTQKDIPIGNIDPILATLFQVGDDLDIPEDRGRGFADIGNDVRMGRIVYQLLKRLDNASRFEVLERAVQSGGALSFIQHQLIVLGQQQGRYPEQQASAEAEWLVSREQLSALEDSLLERIRGAARDGLLLETPKLPFVLNFWREKATQDEVASWVSQAVKEDECLIEIVEGYLQTSKSMGLDDAVVRQQDRLDPDWLRPYLDPERVAERLRNLLPDTNLTPRQTRAIDQFLKEYDFRQRGGNPNDPFAQIGGTS
jgi:predicted KAP-like P-loop ATPase